MSERRREVVCAVHELPPGERLEIGMAAEYGITVFNLDGEFFALRNRDPHRGGPLCRGRLRPHAAASAVGEWIYEREDEIFKCPCHNWEFDIRTGRAMYDERLRVRTYPVVVEDGQVVLGTHQVAPIPTVRGRPSRAGARRSGHG